MESPDQIVAIVALSIGTAWACGLNLYATILVLGGLSTSGSIDLPPDLQILGNPLLIAAAGIMYCVEFFCDKIPGIDNRWDVIHSFIRIPAGALLAAGAISHISPLGALAAALVGGCLTAATHAAKAGSRVLINASPQPLTNWTVSLGEDTAVIAGLWASLRHPEIFIGLLIILVCLMIWLLPRIWRGVRKVFGFYTNLVGSKKASEPLDQL